MTFRGFGFTTGMWLSGLCWGQVLQSEGFESFTTGELQGQAGWLALPGGSLFDVMPGMVEVTTLMAKSGAKSVRLRSDLLVNGESLFAFKPLGTPVGNSSSLVICDFWMASQGSAAARFGGASYSSTGDFLASVTAEAEQGSVMASWLSTPVGTIVPQNWNRVTVVHNMAANQVVAYMNGQGLGSVSGNFLPANFSDMDFYADGGGASQSFFDDISIEKTGLGVIRGHLELGDYIAPPQGVPTEVSINDAATGSPILVLPLLLRADGMISVSTGLRGTFDVRFKPWHWVSKTFNNVEISDLGAHFLDYSATNGDADGSDEVDAADIDAVISAFGLTGLPNNIREDVDGSGEVDAVDIDIVIGNFGAAGD
ncbi:MAG: hypothetical protein IT205_06645 [Fimbriimonadaceae bacterium]|nr:hypothetical protein [Fimbriimonadaceae bacterium]